MTAPSTAGLVISGFTTGWPAPPPKIWLFCKPSRPSNCRRRLPWQGLATGEHWYAVLPFFHAARAGLADVLQPDIEWVGGMTACVKICHIAEAAGRAVALHAGMNTPYGQHLTLAMPCATWGEYFVYGPPGVAPERMVAIPGTPVPRAGGLRPSEAPGFGMEIDLRWIESVAA